MKVFITGASSGIGQQCFELLKTDYQVTAPTRSDLDLCNFDSIDQLDLSEYDYVINCAGANQGTNLGLHNNSWQNQIGQVNVNFLAPLLLAKQYTKQRPSGHFIYVTSSSIDDPAPYHIFMVSGKAALRFSMDVLKKHYTKFIFTEICPGKTKTNMLKQNYQGTKTDAEIAAEYQGVDYLTADQVAEAVITAMKLKLDQVKILPHGNNNK